MVSGYHAMVSDEPVTDTNLLSWLQTRAVRILQSAQSIRALLQASTTLILRQELNESLVVELEIKKHYN